MTLSKEERHRILSEAGRKGGKAKVPKGYSMNLKLASESGKKGKGRANREKRT